jgi:hypothetical protein
MTDHIKRRHEIMSMHEAQDIADLIDRCALGTKDKQFLKMVYVDRVAVAAAGDLVGFYGRSATRHLYDGTLAMWLVLHHLRM